jgi:histidinol-phosphate/aromatic aminotransferase/cobyric acid decarboxylase-like protein
MDLSTCVNRYGPAPAAVSALRRIRPADIVLHPYDAADQMIDLYRWSTDVRYGAMIAGRGASEFIWAMGRELNHRTVRIPLPGYTDDLKVFPGRGFSVAGFTPNPVARSVIGCDAPDVVVLQSTTKFYGIAATRTGITWSAEARLLRRLFGRQENWGLSGVDVCAACAAVRDVDWADDSRRRMLDDSAWLAELLSGVEGMDLCANPNVHFQYAFCEAAIEAAAALCRRGIGVRVLGAAHAVQPGALRIVAPRADERERFAAAVGEVFDAAYGVTTAVAFSLTFAALSRIGASQTAVVMTLEAVSTVVLAALVLGESVSVGQACGGLAVIGAAAVTAWSRATESVTDRGETKEAGATRRAAEGISSTISLVRRRSRSRIC